MSFVQWPRTQGFLPFEELQGSVVKMKTVLEEVHHF